MKKTVIIAFALLININAAADEIHEAARNGNLDKVMLLIENDIRLLDKKDAHGKTALYHAIETGKNDVSLYLLEKGSDLGVRDDRYGATPFHYAAAQGNVEIAQAILEKKSAVLEERDRLQKTALLIACENGKEDMVIFLLDQGADIEIRDHLGLTALMSACSGWNMEIVELLIKKGVDINEVTIYQDKEYTALTVAALYGFRDMVDYLIELNAVVPESVREITLRYAVRGDHEGLLEYLGELGMEIGGKAMAEQEKLVYLASAAGSERIFRALLERGFDPGKKDRYGWTVLHHAASANKVDMIRFLLEELDPEFNARSRRGETAYDVSLFLGYEETAQYLKSMGADTSGPVFPEITGRYMGQSPPGEIPEMFMPGIVSGPYRAHGTVVFSPDGKEAYWSDMIPGTQCAMEMKMTGNRWTYPQRSVMWKDPSISPDGNKLIFISNQPLHEGDPGGKENYWFMDRTDSGWTEPKPMDMAINKINIHWHCSMDNLGNMYFSEFADNMYVSELKDGQYQEPVNLKDHLNNSTFKGHCPFMSPTRDYLIFADEEHLYVSFRNGDGSWTDRIDLGDGINSGAGNGSPKVTYDGEYLFFQSTQGDERPWGIYWVSFDVIRKLKEDIIMVN